MFDTVITNARIADGSGNPWFPGSVGISSGRIEAVGKFDGSAEARQVIDAGGHMVAPGFIDIHSHSEFLLPVEGHDRVLAPFVKQGITTIVTGNCGYAPAPVNPATLDQMKSYTTFLKGPELSWQWRSFGEFLDYLDEHGVVMNVVPMVAHGPIRIHEVGFEGRELKPDEVTRMKELIRRSVAEGAFGFSTGLLYAPGIFAPPEEIIDLASALPKDAVYTSHIRGSSETLLPATREVIRVGEENGIACQHSHIEAFGRPNWPKIDQAIQLHEQARARGVDTGFDVIPYVAANTTLLAVYPPWALAGGVDALLERLHDPATRKKVHQSIEEDVPGWPCWMPGGWPHNLVEATGWKNVWVMWVESERNKDLEGKSLQAIADERGRDPFDVAADLTIEENGHAMCLYFGVSGELGEERWLEKLMAHPYASFETDAILTGKGVPHPAGYGAFPRVLGHFVRNRKLFPLEDAVRRITALPAQRFGLRQRGTIRRGAFADLVIFDAETIDDRTTYVQPMMEPVGIDYVLINGNVAVDHGRFVEGKLSGQVIRRGGANA
jgi:N-acyl-D-amino-acid deacylase